MKTITKICGHKKDRALSWFPWITNNITKLDLVLVDKLNNCKCSDVTLADATIILRWFSHAPRGFMSVRDYDLAEHLMDKLPNSLSV